jgi:hypothetical protein
MHDARAGETQRLTGEALQTRAQGEVLTLDLLHRQFPYRVLRGREVPPIDSRLVRVIVRDAKGDEQGLEFQEHRILTGADDIREYSPGAMVKRMPQPPCTLFGADKTPHLIQLGGALWADADGVGAWTRRGQQRGVDVSKRGDFFLTRRLRSWD